MKHQRSSCHRVSCQKERVPLPNSGFEVDTTYLLEIELERERDIRIGKLGEFHFPSGLYLYVGSAKKNLRQRIERHLRKEKKRFWHIDYLLAYGTIRGVWTGEAKEEDVADRLEKSLATPILGFGSSDTRRNRTHLFRGDINGNLLSSLGFKRWR